MSSLHSISKNSKRNTVSPERATFARACAVDAFNGSYPHFSTETFEDRQPEHVSRVVARRTGGKPTREQRMAQINFAELNAR